jgi:hypothetical protein
MGMAKVASFASRLEAGYAASILESNGIMHSILADDVGIFGPGHQGPVVRGVDLLVAEPDLAQARQLLEDAGLLESSES